LSHREAGIPSSNYVESMPQFVVVAEAIVVLIDEGKPARLVIVPVAEHNCICFMQRHVQSVGDDLLEEDRRHEAAHVDDRQGAVYFGA
jgi:hypothetical protein